jgi:hypothetical protein
MNIKDSPELPRKESDYNIVDCVKSISYIKLIVIVDIFVISCTFLRYGFPHLSDNKILGWMTSRFDLAVEMNFAIWWSSILLFLIGFLAYQNSLASENSTKKSWLGISMIFVGLSIDEIGSLHERIQYWSLLAPIGLLCVIVLSYSLLGLFRKREGRLPAVLISVAIFLFALTAFQEYLEQTLEWSSWAIGFRVTIEEGTELAGSLIGLIGVASYPSRKTKRKLADLLPTTSTIDGIRIFLLAFLVVHLFLSMAVFSWSHFTRWGNPVVWYPTVVYFILFLRYLNDPSGRSGEPLFVALSRSVIYLLFSAIIPYVFVSTRVLNLNDERWILDRSFLLSFLTFYYVLQFLCIAFNWKEIRRDKRIIMPTLLIVVGNAVSLTYYRNLVVVFVVVGLNSYLFFRLMVMNDTSVTTGEQATAIERGG